MPLTLTPQSRIRFAPMRIWPCYGTTNIAYACGKASGRWASFSAARRQKCCRARGLRDQAVLRSEEAPTLMALGGFEQLTLDPSRADSPKLRGLSEVSQRKRRWSAMNGFSCTSRAACFTANTRSSALIKIEFIFTLSYTNRRARELRQN